MRFILILSCFLLSPLAVAQEEAPKEEAAAAASAEEASPAEEAAPAADAEAPKEEAEEAPAEESEESVSAEDAGEVAGALAQALQDKNWALVFGLLLSMLVAVANKFGLKDKVGGKAVPWVTSGLAVVGSVAAALVGGIPVFDAVSQGLVAGVAAIGGWEMILKHLLVKKTDEA